MKTGKLILLGAAVALLAGCVVTSVSPFYTEKDRVREPAILGDWINQRGDEVWRFEEDADVGYRFTLIEERKATVMKANAFKLEGQLFLDIASLEQDYHVIPAHYLLKVRQLAPTFKMSELDHTWLINLLTSHPGLLRHEVVQTGDRAQDRRVVLTASTRELQEFIRKHCDSKEAWRDSIELQREQPRVGTVNVHTAKADETLDSLAVRSE